MRKSPQRPRKAAKKVLVVDVGGTHVKVYAPGYRTPLKIDSGPNMTPQKMIESVLKATMGWKYDVVSLGYPGPVQHGKPLRDPVNLGPGWVEVDFQKAFGCPVLIINDAAMQALGSYHGGRMLFLGLGTGLGSALIVDGLLEPLELGHLPYRRGKTFEGYLGAAALKRRGKKKWIKNVFEVVAQLKNALQVDYVVLGGGNCRKLTTLPSDTALGENEAAREGGVRLWNEAGMSTLRTASVSAPEWMLRLSGSCSSHYPPKVRSTNAGQRRERRSEEPC